EEVWLPLLTSLLTMLVVFLPIIFIDKTVQLTYGGFAFTISISLIQTSTASEPYATRTVWKGVLFYTGAAFITEVCARK
ncbi:MAG TPA: hypothetical protein PKN21_12145, partial [Bacteroidales bacterium]|nr:hypothetical protein [Bacteroidales bacterium]